MKSWNIGHKWLEQISIVMSQTGITLSSLESAGLTWSPKLSHVPGGLMGVFISFANAFQHHEAISPWEAAQYPCCLCCPQPFSWFSVAPRTEGLSRVWRANHLLSCLVLLTPLSGRMDFRWGTSSSESLGSLPKIRTQPHSWGITCQIHSNLQDQELSLFRSCHWLGPHFFQLLKFLQIFRTWFEILKLFPAFSPIVRYGVTWSPVIDYENSKHYTP